MILRKTIIFFPIAEGGAKIFGVFRVKFILGLIIIIYSILFYSILFEKKKWSLEELNKNVYIIFSAYDAFLCTCMLSDNQFNSIVY